jgi:hypothetical protein
VERNKQSDQSEIRSDTSHNEPKARKIGHNWAEDVEECTYLYWDTMDIGQ